MADRVLTIDVPDDDLEGIVDSGNQDRAPAAKKEGGEANDGIELLKGQVADLTKERDEKTRAAEDAERRRLAAEAETRRQADAAVRARKDAESAKAEGTDVQRIAIDNAIGAAQSAADSAEVEYAAAFEAGDAKKAAAAQRKIARAEAELAQLQAGKAALPDKTAATTGRVEARSEAAVETRQQQDQPATEEERIDRYISQFSGPSQAWLRKHKECVTNQAKNLLVMAADAEAVEQGLRRDTQEYFSYIDRRLGYAKGEDDRDAGRGDGNGRQQQDRRSQERQEDNGMAASRASAPVRGAGNGASRSTAIDLTPGQQEKATDGSIVWNVGQRGPDGKIINSGSPLVDQPIGVKEYARRMLSMKKEGRLETPYA